VVLGLVQRRDGALPAEVTGFVGRRAEPAQLAGLLESARLVTVTGPGGVGKTRVSLRAAAEAAAGYGDRRQSPPFAVLHHLTRRGLPVRH
jgi:tRNA A37 threonylcarbamoyladenosine biosynthesis protein TsaE